MRNVRETRSAPGLGETIRRLREERGWLQEELARRAGITQAQVSRLESGDQDDPRTSTLVGLADAFGLRLDALIGRGQAGHHRGGPRRVATDNRACCEQARPALAESWLSAAVGA